MAPNARSSVVGPSSHSYYLRPRQTHRALESRRSVHHAKLLLSQSRSKKSRSKKKARSSVAGPPSHSYYLRPRQTHRELESKRSVGCAKLHPSQSRSKKTLDTRIENADPAASSLRRNPMLEHKPQDAMEESSELTQKSASASEHPQTIDVKSSTADERSFTLFPMLPPELRRIIWSCTLSHPQIIELQTHEMIPHVRESISIMAVCHEAREIALKLYHLVHLGPPVKASPFYFSSQASICLLKEESMPDLMVSPYVFEDESHPWNMFRAQVTVLAVDPLLYFDSEVNWFSNDWQEAASCQAFKITAAISIVPGLKKLIVLRRAGFEKHSIEMVSNLHKWMDEHKLDIVDPMPYQFSSSWKKPAIEYLDYDYEDEEDPWKAMRQALLAYPK